MKSYHHILLLVFSFLVFFSCKTTQSISEKPEIDHTQIIPVEKRSGGSSGMVNYGENGFLVVYDLKIFQKGVRVAHVITSEENIIVNPIIISDWNNEEGISSDLESVSRIPGKEHEFLLCESGNWEGNLGRIFHVNIDTSNNTGEVIGVFKYPVFHINDPGKTGDQYEGSYCYKNNNGEFLILLAERGGSIVNPKGIIRWAKLDFENYKLEFSKQGMDGLLVNAPGIWQNYTQKRSITDLYVNENNEIWASASEDLGDQGPFYSVIYRLGRFQETNNAPIITSADYRLWVEMNGIKIEALAGPSKSVEYSNLSFGTEDEIYGGVWRPLYIK